MSMKKKYTTAEKISIVKEGSKKGVKATLEKYGLYPATYYPDGSGGRRSMMLWGMPAWIME